MFGGIFDFGINRKFSFNHKLIFKLFCTGLSIEQVLSINYIFRFRHGHIHKHRFYGFCLILVYLKRLI